MGNIVVHVVLVSELVTTAKNTSHRSHGIRRRVYLTLRHFRAQDIGTILSVVSHLPSYPEQR